MNFAILGAFLLAQVSFTWDAPPVEENVKKIEIHVSTKKGDYSNAQVINAGLPPVVNGKQAFSSMVDVSSPKWATIRGLNSFGLSDPSSEIYLGKPQPLGALSASPGAN
jgi:hypothetical protein